MDPELIASDPQHCFHLFLSSGEDGTCLGEVTIPAGWWPSLTASRLGKQPKLLIRALDWVVADCRHAAGGHLAELLTPPALVGELPLTLSQMGYRQLAGTRKPRQNRVKND